MKKQFPKTPSSLYGGLSNSGKSFITKTMLGVTTSAAIFPGFNAAYAVAPLCINASANEIREVVNGHFSGANLGGSAQAVCPSGTRPVNVGCVVTTGHVSGVLNGEIRVTPSIDSITATGDCRRRSNDGLTTDQDDFDNRNNNNGGSSTSSSGGDDNDYGGSGGQTPGDNGSTNSEGNNTGGGSGGGR